MKNKYIIGYKKFMKEIIKKDLNFTQEKFLKHYNPEEESFYFYFAKVNEVIDIEQINRYSNYLVSKKSLKNRPIFIT